MQTYSLDTHPYEYQVPRKYLIVVPIPAMGIKSCTIQAQVKLIINEFNKQELKIITTLGYNHATLHFKSDDDMALFILHLP
jgi:hypothetical protein